MTLISKDFETELIMPGNMAPRAACMTWRKLGEGPNILWARDKEVPHLLHSWLTNDHLVGHNMAFDMGVVCRNYPELLPYVFKAYDECRVTDTMIRQQLLDIASGCFRKKVEIRDGEAHFIKINYDLQACTKRHTGRLLKKDGFRLFYQFFMDYPLDQWPSRAAQIQEWARAGDPGFMQSLVAIQLKELPGMIAADPFESVKYPMDDADATLDVCISQEAHAAFLQNQYKQAYKAWWQHLMSAYGLMTSNVAVQELRLRTEQRYEEVKARLIESGLVRKDGSRDTKAAKALMEEACLAQGLPVRKTPAGQVSMDADACEDIEHPIIEDYSEYQTLSKVLGTDIPMLAAGTRTPIHTRMGMAETGRSTSSNPNIQNLRRLPGIRECIRPRPGYVFIQADFDQLELRTLAQVCIQLLGRSTLAKILNAGKDPHLEVARVILGLTYEDAKANKKRKDVDDARQAGKVANFGFPGGLGPDRLVYFAKKTYGVIMNKEKAIELKQMWIETLPEMKDYFDFINSLPQANGGRFMEQVYSKRYRANTTFSQACIGYYQGLGADATNEAGWAICKACYTDKNSPLYGSRLVCYVHDEFIVETPEANAHEAALEMVRLMIAGASLFLPDVPPTTDPVLMRMWSKEAKQVWQDGRLVPWDMSIAA